KEAGSRKWLYRLIAGGIVIGLFVRLGNSQARDYWPLAAAGIAVLAFSALPNLWAYSGSHVISDFVVTLIALLVLAVALLTAACVGVVHGYIAAMASNRKSPA